MQVNVAKCLKQVKNPVAAAALVLVTGIVTYGATRLADTFVDARYEFNGSPMGCHVGPAPKERTEGEEKAAEAPFMQEEITMTLSEEELERFLRSWRDDESRAE